MSELYKHPKSLVLTISAFSSVVKTEGSLRKEAGGVVEKPVGGAVPEVVRSIPGVGGTGVAFFDGGMDDLADADVIGSVIGGVGERAAGAFGGGANSAADVLGGFVLPVTTFGARDTVEDDAADDTVVRVVAGRLGRGRDSAGDDGSKWVVGAVGGIPTPSSDRGRDDAIVCEVDGLVTVACDGAVVPGGRDTTGGDVAFVFRGVGCVGVACGTIFSGCFVGIVSNHRK